MQWSEAIKEHIQALKSVQPTQVLVERIIRLIDLTSLNNDDTEESVTELFKRARTPFGDVAAVCINPDFVGLAAAEFAGSNIKTATVANFPSGDSALESVLAEINYALDLGAQEIDVVFPYLRYLAGERQYTHQFILACKAACGDAALKVILETGALSDPAIIADASYDALAAGADFIKTSTGKFHTGATLEAAAVMLLVVRHITPQLKHRVGIKVSGGIRELNQAVQYVMLADDIMGKGWVTASTFRIGASKLIDEMIKISA